MDIIFKRRSIRKFTEEKVSKEKVEKIIRAAMAAPSSENEQPMYFVVIDDRSMLLKISEFIWSAPVLKNCDCAILTCANLQLVNNQEEGWWIQDCAA